MTHHSPGAALVAILVVLALAAGCAAPPTIASSPPATPLADPLAVEPPNAEWSTVSWARVPLPAVPGAPAGRDRLDGLIPGGPGLVGWGRMAAPNRNQFNDVAAIYLSVDGGQWLVVPLVAGVGANDTAEIHRVVAGPAGLLAVGGTCCDDEKPSMWRSADGRAWERIPYPDALFGAEIHDMIGLPAAYVAGGTVLGSAALWVSADGLEWRAVDAAAADLGPGLIADLAVSGTGAIAVGHRQGATWDGAFWSSAEGLAWSRTAIGAPFVGDLDVTLYRVTAVKDRLLVTGNEGDPAERRRGDSKGSAGQRLATADSPLTPPDAGRDFICGWGSEVRWLGAANNWRVVGGAGQNPGPGELLEFHNLHAGDVGVLAIGEGRDQARQTLWISPDGSAFTRLAADGGPEPGDSVSGFVRLGNRVVAVGEHWDPKAGEPGVPAVWIGLLR